MALPSTLRLSITGFDAFVHTGPRGLWSARTLSWLVGDRPLAVL